MMRFMFKKLFPILNHDTYNWRSPIKEVGCRLFSASNSVPEDSTSSNKSGDHKLLKVAIVGVPNAGKSTLINQIVGKNICAMSRKVHTTRCCARAVINVDKTQLIFLDTPGVVSAKEGLKFRLERSCLVDTEKAIQEADVIGVLHDVSNKYTMFKLDPKILRLLYLYSQKDSFLILNKEMINEENGWSHFQSVFMVSGLTGDGVGDIQIYLTDLARPGQWVFPEKLFTDQNEIKIIQDTVFSKLLDNIPYEVPYNIRIEIEYFDIADDGSVTIVINLLARTERIRHFLIGEKGKTIRKVAEDVEQSLKQFYLNEVRVKLILKKGSKDDFNSAKSLSEGDKEMLRGLS